MITAAVYTDFRGHYSVDPQRSWKLDKYLTRSDVTIVLGTRAMTANVAGNILVYVDMESPNHTFVGVSSGAYDVVNEKFALVMNLCPYTCRYLNHKYNTTKYVETLFPVEADGLPAPNPPECRDLKVFYVGHVHDDPVVRMIRKVVTWKLPTRVLNQLDVAMETATFDVKMATYNRAKIAIVHNTLPQLNKLPKWAEADTIDPSIALWYKPGDAPTPQMKSRMTEAAAMQCVILCYRNDANGADLIEQRYYQPGVHFLYWSEQNELANLIDHVLDNYNDYVPMAQRARALTLERYTTQAMVTRIEQELV